MNRRSNRMTSNRDFASLFKDVGLSQRQPRAKLNSRVIVCYQDHEQIDARELLKELDYDAIMFQGPYGSSLWTAAESVLDANPERQAFVYDSYQLSYDLTQRIAMAEGPLYRDFLPAVRAMAEAGFRTALSQGETAVYIQPAMDAASRKWFLDVTRGRRRVIVVTLSSPLACEERELENPRYRERVMTIGSHLERTFDMATYPPLSEGWDRVVFILDRSRYPLYIKDNLIDHEQIAATYEDKDIKLIDV